MNRSLLRFALSAAMALPALAHAQEFPQRAITIIDAYPAGGSTDVLSRILGEKLRKNLGQPVIVEARPGAAGTIGAAAVARAQPDGYTIFVGNPGLNAIAATAFSKLPYDVEKDFEPIIIAASVPILFCVPTNSRIRTPAELIAAGKASDGMNFGSTGQGGLSHIVGELFNREAGTRYRHVPYRGGAPLAVAVMSGEIEVGVMASPDALPHVRAGKIRCVANAGAQRSPQFPDVPTLAESGLSNVKSDVWFGYLAPAKTPKAVVQKLNAEFTKALAEPDVKARLDELALVPSPGTPEAFAARIKADRETYGQIIKAIGLRLD